MENQPQRWINRLLEWAVMFALAAFFLRLGVAYLREIWWVLLLILGVITGAVIVYRLYRFYVE